MIIKDGYSTLQIFVDVHNLKYIFYAHRNAKFYLKEFHVKHIHSLASLCFCESNIAPVATSPLGEERFESNRRLVQSCRRQVNNPVGFLAATKFKPD